MKKKNQLHRSDVPVESTWHREAIYTTWEAWQADYRLALAELDRLAAFKNRLGKDPDTLLAWFQEYERQWDRELKLFVFAYMAAAVDSKDMTAKAYQGQASTLWARLNAASAFAETELMAMPEKLLEWCAADPRLGVYQYYFKELQRLAPHRRSSDVEEVLSILQDSHYQVVLTAQQLTNTDLKFAEAVDSQGQRHPVHQATNPPIGIQSPDREHRRNAWESFCDGHLAFQNTLASNYVTRVKQVVNLAKIRGYDSVLGMMLGPANLPVSIFHNVIDTFQAQLPVWHRYWEVRRQILGVEALRPYDIWAPIRPDEPVIPFAQAVDWISESLAPLGEAYVKIICEGCLQDRWVDYAPNCEKEQGAAAFWPTPQMPAFIFIGYTENAYSMSVLAHELGHALHFYLAANNQPRVYRDFARMSSAVAETASNFHQAMLRAYLGEVKYDDRSFRIAMLDEAITNFHRYFFIMPLLAQFELDVYRRAEQNQPLNAPILNQIMRDLFAEGYGQRLDDDPGRTAITWAQFMHLYDPFYTFQYAAGITAAHALAVKVKDSQEAADRYVQFLRAGNSLPPLDAWALAGVDMTTPEPIQQAFGVLAGLVEQLAELARQPNTAKV